MMDLLIKNAQLVNQEEVIPGNLAVKDGRIAAILPLSDEPAAKEIIDLKNNYLLPGGIDDHVHFNDPGYIWREDFLHGSRAAAAGGITTVIDMPMQNKPAVADAAVLEQKAAGLVGRSYIDYGFWGALIRTNADELAGLNKAGALAFKCFMCDPGKDYTELKVAEIEERLQVLKQFNGLAGFHCEDYDMIKNNEAMKIDAGKVSRQDYLEARPVEAELQAVADIIKIAKKNCGRVHICHVSHPAVAELIRQAKLDGVNITAETCMHYLLFTEQDLVLKGTAYKCSPPLRDAASAALLWEYIVDGTLDCICSDHSPSKLEEKNEDTEKGTFGAWGGISGVQSGMQTLWNYIVHKKGASPTLITKVLAANPAKVFGIYGRKGAICEGFDADFCVIDDNQEWEITPDSLEYVNKFSAFCGQKGHGKVIMTFVRGNVVYNQGNFSKPVGKLLRRMEKKG